MKKKQKSEENTGSGENLNLRRRAEDRIKSTPPPAQKFVSALSDDDAQRLIHELQVHQIELEIQNEELRRIYTELETSRIRYYDLYNLAPLGYVTLNINGDILESNLTLSAMLNMPRGSLDRQPLARYIFIDDREIFYKYTHKLLETGLPQSCELRMINNDNVPFWTQLKANVHHDTDGVMMLRTIITDISIRIHLEEELFMKDAKLQQLFNLLPIGLFITDSANRIMNANPAIKKILGLSESDLQKKLYSSLSFISPDGTDLKPDDYPWIRAAKVLQPIENIEIGLVKNDKSITWINMNSIPSRQSHNNWEIISSMTDITKRREADDLIKDLLSEKQILLQEVHHRVKNNLFTIYSMLSLQISDLTEPSAIEALNDTLSRVSSMMVLYDKLTRFKSYSEISLKDYLPSLIHDIVAMYPDSSFIKIENHIDDIILDIKKIMPLGLIINELMTNIMKYAFAGKCSGTISIAASSAYTDAEYRASITIHDNGIGIPEDVDIENSTGFGMMIVGALIKQLNGSITIKRDNGTKILLEFQP
jgi:PAS domain S-box-containing protein